MLVQGTEIVVVSPGTAVSELIPDDQYGALQVSHGLQLQFLWRTRLQL